MIYRLMTIFVLALFCPTLWAVPQPAALEPTEIQLNSLTLDQLQQAAQAGDPDAQYALGYMYYNGKNVAQNTQVALDWIKRAAVQGQEQAVKALALLGQSQNNAAIQNSAPAPVSSVSTVNQVHQTSTTNNHQINPSSNTPVVVNPPMNQGKNQATQPQSANQSSEILSTSELFAAPVNTFTIQLLASQSKDDVVRYSKKHHLQGKAVYYLSNLNGKSWYVLVYGIYDSKAEAQAALNKLPASLREQNPWVKSMGLVKNSMKEQG